jgi:hypothetical protein
VLCCLRLGSQGSQDGGKNKSQVHKFYPWLLVQSLIHTGRRSSRRIAPRDMLKNVSQVRNRFLDAEGDFVGFPSIQELMLLNPKDWDDLFEAVAK